MHGALPLTVDEPQNWQLPSIFPLLLCAISRTPGTVGIRRPARRRRKREPGDFQRQKGRFRKGEGDWPLFGPNARGGASSIIRRQTAWQFGVSAAAKKTKCLTVVFEEGMEGKRRTVDIFGSFFEGRIRLGDCLVEGSWGLGKVLWVCRESFLGEFIFLSRAWSVGWVEKLEIEQHFWVLFRRGFHTLKHFFATFDFFVLN